LNVPIQGGASKLLSACREWSKDNGYSSISTWSDNRWSIGNVYEKLGFTRLKDNPPDYSYVDIKRKIRIPKQKFKNVKENIEELAKVGLWRIWDCGKVKWVYQIS